MTLKIHMTLRRCARNANYSTCNFDKLVFSAKLCVSKDSQGFINLAQSEIYESNKMKITLEL